MLHSIHALRFIAATAVVVLHAFQWSNTPINVGAAGVDLFFIISGVVIGYATPPGMTATEFLVRRLIRVLPLYWLATVAYMAFEYWAWHKLHSVEEVLRSAALVPDLTKIPWTPIYYPGWSLTYELIFYLACAGLLLWSGTELNRVCAAIFAALAVALTPFPFGHFDATFFIEFAGGLVVAEMLRMRIKLAPATGVLCILLAICDFAIHCRAGGLRVLEWGVPSFLLVLGLLPFEQRAFLQTRIFVVGGNASYAIYLVHATVYNIIIELTRIYRLPFAGFSLLFTLLIIVASIASGVAVHYLIERPLLASLRGVFLRRKIPAPGWIAGTRPT